MSYYVSICGLKTKMDIRVNNNENNDNNVKNLDEEKHYIYYKQIYDLSKKGFGVRILNNNNILARKFDCILNSSFQYIQDDEIPALRDVYVGDYKASFEAEVELFSKELHKVKDLDKPLRLLIDHVKDIYEEIYERLFNRLMLLLGWPNDDYVISCFTIIILIEKTLVKIKNIFID